MTIDDDDDDDSDDDDMNTSQGSSINQ